MEKHDGDHRIDKVWLHFEELIIGLEGVVILVQIVVYMGISNIQLIAIFFTQHVLVPIDSLLQFIRILVFDLIKTKSQSVIYISLEFSCFSLLIVPFIPSPAISV